jgi:MFS family permease
MIEPESPMLPVSPAPPEISLPGRQSGAARNAILTVFLVVLVDLLGFGIVFPLLPRYGEDFIDPLVSGGRHPRLGGLLLGLFMASHPAMQFLFAPLWGRVSDRVGRRPVLLLGLVGSVGSYAVFGFASDLNDAHWRLVGLILLFLSRIGAGAAGATLGTAQAVIADSTSPEHRSRNMALIGAAMGIGLTIGPLLGGVALGLWPEVHGGPGYVAAGFSLVALVLGLWLLPETWRAGSPTGARRWFDWQGLRAIRQDPALGNLVLAFFIAALAFTHFQVTLSLLTQDALQFGDQENSWIWGYAGLILIFSQGGLYQVLTRRLGAREWGLMLAGLVLLVLGLVALAVTAILAGAGSDLTWGFLLAWMMLAVALTGVGFSFLNPSVSTLLSHWSDPGLQGEILGLSQSAMALARILGAVIGVSLYRLPPAHVLPYAVGAALVLGSLALSLRMPRK